MLGMVEVESINSLFLPAGRQGGRGQKTTLSNGVNSTLFRSKPELCCFNQTHWTCHHSIASWSGVNKFK